MNPSERRFIDSASRYYGLHHRHPLAEHRDVTRDHTSAHRGLADKSFENVRDLDEIARSQAEWRERLSRSRSEGRWS